MASVTAPLVVEWLPPRHSGYWRGLKKPAPNCARWPPPFQRTNRRRLTTNLLPPRASPPARPGSGWEARLGLQPLADDAGALLAIVRLLAEDPL
jgi:hypothetical protein